MSKQQQENKAEEKVQQPDNGDAPNEEAKSEQSQDAEKSQKSLEDQLAELQEDLKRAQAETINQARRMNAELEREFRRGIENALSGMPDIVDDLERAIAIETVDHNALRDGVAITLSQFNKLLRGLGVETIAPEPGDRIDPLYHQVISKEESDKQEDHKVLRVVQKGYRHGERILRSASVVASVSVSVDNDSEKDKAENETESKNEKGGNK